MCLLYHLWPKLTTLSASMSPKRAIIRLLCHLSCNWINQVFSMPFQIPTAQFRWFLKLQSLQFQVKQVRLFLFSRWLCLSSRTRCAPNSLPPVELRFIQGLWSIRVQRPVISRSTLFLCPCRLPQPFLFSQTSPKMCSRANRRPTNWFVCCRAVLITLQFRCALMRLRRHRHPPS